MKIEKFVISAMLIFALTNYAYGMGRHHHHRGGDGSTSASSSGSEGDGVTFQAYGDISDGGVLIGGIPPVDGDPGAAPVPEPATMLLLGSGLLGLAGYARRRFKK